jgi:hypothetical protein
MNGYSVAGPSGTQAQLSQQGSFAGNGSTAGMMNGAASGGQPYQQQQQPYLPASAQQQQQYQAQQQPPPGSLPQQQQLQRPSGSQPTGSDVGAALPSFPSSSSPAKAAPSPPRPVVRKRQRIEYEPLRRPFSEFPASWDPVQVEEVVSVTAAKRAKRTAKYLGGRALLHSSAAECFC